MFESDPAVAPSASDFVERMLRDNPDVSFAAVKERAATLGFNVPPFLYGATRRRLGLAPRPDGSADAARESTPVDRSTAGAATADSGTADSAIAHSGIAESGIADSGIGDSGSGPPAEAAAPQQEAPAPQTPDEPTAANKTKAPSGFQFAVDVLRMQPEISFQDLKARAAMEGYKLQPIVYGRAKALLGLVPTKPRQPKAAPKSLQQVDSPASFEMPTGGGLGSIEKLVETVRALDNDRKRLHEVLNAIYEICDNALHGVKQPNE